MEVAANEEGINVGFAYSFQDYQKKLPAKKIAGVTLRIEHSFVRNSKNKSVNSCNDFLQEIRIMYACKLLSLPQKTHRQKSHFPAKFFFFPYLRCIHAGTVFGLDRGASLKRDRESGQPHQINDPSSAAYATSIPYHRG
jgi:hypothetical protein